MSPGSARAAKTSVGGWIRRLAPWAVAIALLAYLFATTPYADLRDAIARTSLWRLGLLVVAYVAALLVVDSLAMWVGFREAIPEAKIPLKSIIEIRGASYLLAIINYGAGQGGIVYFLSRSHGIKVAAGAGAVLLTSGAFIIVIALVVGVGMLAGAVPDTPELKLVAVAVVGALPAYLGVIALKPRFLLRWAFLRPLFDAGVLGTLRVAGARGLHIMVLIAGHGAALWLFGVEVPLDAALAGLPVLFLVTAIPISPAGLGTTQAAAITLFASYSTSSTESARQASVLAYSLSLQALATLLVVLVGIVCLRRLTRATPAPDDAFDSSPSAP